MAREVFDQSRSSMQRRMRRAVTAGEECQFRQGRGKERAARKSTSASVIVGTSSSSEVAPPIEASPATSFEALRLARKASVSFIGAKSCFD